MPAEFAIGSLVRARERDWVVLAPEQPDVLRLRALTGREDDVTGIYLPLEGDRRLITDLLIGLRSSVVRPRQRGRDREAQLAWLRERVDPASTFEREFVEHLYRRDLRLPDHVQYRPVDDLAVQTDFYYERDGLGGVCVFLDGPAHQDQRRAERDRAVREELANRGYRIVVITAGRDLDEQLAEFGDVFGAARAV